MLVVDIHAHVTPDRYKDAIERDGSWHGLGPKAGQLHNPGFLTSMADRIAEMDEMGVDLQVVTPTVGFYQYDNDVATTTIVARECNDSLAKMISDHPGRFAGLCTVPMQNIPAAIAELERSVNDLGLHGVVVSDHVNGQTYDQPHFLPFFKAAESLGALVFFHQGGDTCVSERINRYSLPNGVGNSTERTLTFGALVFGGVMDRCPDLKALLAHGGGYVTYGAGRLDKVAGAQEESYKGGPLLSPFGSGPSNDDDFVLTRPPSTYIKQFYYDCCTYDERSLRFIIDQVGIDRVMLGTDYPAPMLLKDAVRWVEGLSSITDTEKEAILSKNATALLGL
jgi:aminocarboxymuconate-semialdehyde decarboxylase